MKNSKEEQDRSLKVKAAIERVFKENKEMLDKLGSDCDSSGCHIGEKYEERLKYMEDNGI